MRDNLIIDAGMHDGTDTAYYLAKGFDVVAIEGDPGLVAAAEERFAAEVERGALTLVNAAIAEESGTVEMAIADEVTFWSSIDPAFIARNQGNGVAYRTVTVPALRFGDVIDRYGVPYYLKIDIEGMDLLPVRALHELADRPRYVSLESNVTANEAPFDRVFEELAELWSLGYRAFKYVNQRCLDGIRLPARPLEGRYVEAQFTGHSSGPFGEETPGRWLTVRQALMKAELLRLKHHVGGYGGKWSATPAGTVYKRAREKLAHRDSSWYDLHARLGE